MVDKIILCELAMLHLQVGIIKNVGLSKDQVTDSPNVTLTLLFFKTDLHVVFGFGSQVNVKAMLFRVITMHSSGCNTQQSIRPHPPRMEIPTPKGGVSLV